MEEEQRAIRAIAPEAGRAEASRPSDRAKDAIAVGRGLRSRLRRGSDAEPLRERPPARWRPRRQGQDRRRDQAAEPPQYLPPRHPPCCIEIERRPRRSRRG